MPWSAIRFRRWWQCAPSAAPIAPRRVPPCKPFSPAPASSSLRKDQVPALSCGSATTNAHDDGMRAGVKKLLRLTALVLAVALGAESGARLDDRLFEQIPFSANPSSDDLITRDPLGRHGTPYAHFKKWRLDNLGFRGPDVARVPTPGVPRILILGASETFGLY